MRFIITTCSIIILEVANQTCFKKRMLGTQSKIFNENTALNNAQKIVFSIKDFFSKCDQSRSFLRIWSHLLNKSLMENTIFCAVKKSAFGNFLIHIFPHLK